MRWSLLVMLIVISACSRVENNFVVEDEQDRVVEAKLVLCGSETPFKRMGERLEASRTIDCEGSGYIRLHYALGEEHECPVGYVTPGLETTFTYQATESGCR